MTETTDPRNRLHGPIPIPEQMLQAILRHHQQPQRYYHTIEHVCAVLDEHRALQELELWQQPVETYLAFLYHDAIYDYGAKDNEQRSAELAVRELQQWLPGCEVQRVHRLIVLTASHGDLDRRELDHDERLFLDCDMAIVGADWQRFSLYQQQIEQEYTLVYPQLLYRMGRRRFLNKILSSERIFFSDHFHHQFDAQARSNLRRALGGH